MSASMAVHLTTWSIEAPALPSAARTFSSAWRVSASIPPGASRPVLSAPIWPAR